MAASRATAPAATAHLIRRWRSRDISGITPEEARICRSGRRPHEPLPHQYLLELRGRLFRRRHPRSVSCSAFGATPEEALAEVLVLDSWLETSRELAKPIPEPPYRPESQRIAG